MDTKILDSWHKNAAPWVTAVRDNEIESRPLATNQAIVDAVRSLSPDRPGHRLRRRLAGAGPAGVAMTGVDVVPELVEAARLAGGGDFRVMSYEEIAQGQLALAVDVAVCNFSLIGEDAVAGLFRAAPCFLRPGGALVVQTMHPLVACGDAPYEDGWREGSWAGFNPASPILRPGTSVPWAAGSGCTSATVSGCWTCASPCIRRPASRPR